MSGEIIREKFVDALDEIENEISEGLGFQYEKWRAFAGSLEEETAEWEYDENGAGKDVPAWTCGSCRQRNDMIPTKILYPIGERPVENPYAWKGSRFCPNCGIKMSGKRILRS